MYTMMFQVLQIFPGQGAPEPAGPGPGGRRVHPVRAAGEELRQAAVPRHPLDQARAQAAPVLLAGEIRQHQTG